MNINSALNTEIAYIKLCEVNLHTAISSDVKSAIATITHNFKVSKALSEEGIDLFLHSHLIQVIELSKNNYGCFSGLRSYQIAKTYLNDDHIIPILIHHQLDESELSNLVILDILISHTVFGLDTKVWQLDFSKILKNIDTKILKRFFPAAKNRSTFAKLLKADRRTFLQNKKPIKKIQSKLKSSSLE